MLDQNFVFSALTETVKIVLYPLVFVANVLYLFPCLIKLASVLCYLSLVSCPSEYKSIFLNDSFWCRPIIACNKINNRSNSLILVTNGNNNSNCYCKKNITSYAYSQFCGNKSICSTNNYLDTNTLECLPCPIGCVTCSLNT
jgi:hypothetical protein